MNNAEISAFLETLARSGWQEDYDNCGLLIGSPADDCSGVLISLDVTQAVVAEAVRKNLNLIVAHHPLIFQGLKIINPDTETGATVSAAIKNGISVYAIHTSLDNVLPGVNSEMAARLGLTDGHPLQLKTIPGALPASAHQTLGSGLVAGLPETLGEEQFLARLRAVFSVPVVRHSALTGRRVKKVAICGGAGSFLITSALAAQADAFVTADLKYHEFFKAEGRLLLADIGHFESEQFTIDFLAGEFRKKYPNFAVLKAETRTNPVHYYL